MIMVDKYVVRKASGLTIKVFDCLPLTTTDIEVVTRSPYVSLWNDRKFSMVNKSSS